MAKVQFTSPVGRLVFGSVWDGSTTDSKGQPRIIKSGPNKGQPATQWSFGVAFPKVLANGQPNLEYIEFYKLIHAAGRAGYPQFYNGPVDPLTGLPGVTQGVVFATKIKDGDGHDTKGQSNAQKEGWAGNWVVVFSSMYAPRVFDINIGLSPELQLQDKTRVMPGDYVAINGTVEANIGAESPGVYMNGNMVCFVASGPKIVSGPKASDAFKGVTAGALPPGCVVGATPATVAPLPNGGAVPPAPGAPSVPAGVGMVPNATVIAPPAVPHDPLAKATADGWVIHPSAPGYRYKGQDVKSDAEVAALYPAPFVPPAPPAAPPAPPAPPVAPNHGFVTGAAGTTPPAPPAPPAGPQLTPAAIAVGFSTYDAAIAAGWTADALRAAGYLA